MAAVAILNFEKNVNNFGLDIDLCTKFGVKCAVAMRTCLHDQKPKPEVSSRDVIKWMLGPKGRRSQRHYDRYLNHIWYRVQAPHY